MRVLKWLARFALGVFVGYFLIGMPANIFVQAVFYDGVYAGPAVNGLVLLICTAVTVALFTFPRKKQRRQPVRRQQILVAPEPKTEHWYPPPVYRPYQKLNTGPHYRPVPESAPRSPYPPLGASVPDPEYYQ